MASVHHDDGFPEEKALIENPKKPQKSISAVFLFNPNLIQIELHPTVIPFQKVDFINPILFVIIKDLDVLVFQQVQINLMPVVANAHDKSSF